MKILKADMKPDGSITAWTPLRRSEEAIRELFSHDELKLLKRGRVLQRGVRGYKMHESEVEKSETPKAVVSNIMRGTQEAAVTATEARTSGLNPSQQIMLQWLRENNDKVPEWAKFMTISGFDDIEVYSRHPDHSSFADEKGCYGYINFNEDNDKWQRLGDFTVPNWREALLDLNKVDWKVKAPQLNAYGQALAEEFEAAYGDGGCTCFISAPCSYCTHPGNPISLEGTPEAWDDFKMDSDSYLTSIAHLNDQPLNPSQLQVAEFMRGKTFKTAPDWDEVWAMVDGGDRTVKLWGDNKVRCEGVWIRGDGRITSAKWSPGYIPAIHNWKESLVRLK